MMVVGSTSAAAMDLGLPLRGQLVEEIWQLKVIALSKVLDVVDGLCITTRRSSLSSWTGS